MIDPPTPTPSVCTLMIRKIFSSKLSGSLHELKAPHKTAEDYIGKGEQLLLALWLAPPDHTLLVVCSL